MPYEKPEIIAGNMEEREAFSCGCPMNVSSCFTLCLNRS